MYRKRYRITLVQGPPLWPKTRQRLVDFRVSKGSSCETDSVVGSIVNGVESLKEGIAVDEPDVIVTQAELNV